LNILTENKQYIFLAYLTLLFILAVIPINGTSDILDNNYTFNIRWDYLVHALVYLPMFPLIKFRNFKTSKLQNLKFLILSLLIAISLECVQLLTPWRTFNVNDMLGNGIGVLVGIIIMIIFRNNIVLKNT
jgi:VanZ family protein